MKATVLISYTDKYTGEVHWQGETVELTAARAKELTASRHVAAIEEKPKTTRKRATAKKTAE